MDKFDDLPEELQTEMEREYHSLLSSGMFFELHPNLTGNWEHDKQAFSEISASKNID